MVADGVQRDAARPKGERIAVLQCIGCGAVNLLRDCLGTCLDRPLELVPATELDEAEAERMYELLFEDEHISLADVLIAREQELSLLRTEGVHAHARAGPPGARRAREAHPLRVLRAAAGLVRLSRVARGAVPCVACTTSGSSPAWTSTAGGW